MTRLLHIAVLLISPHLLSKTSILLLPGLYVFPMLDTVVNRLSQKIQHWSSAAIRSKSHSQYERDSGALTCTRWTAMNSFSVSEDERKSLSLFHRHFVYDIYMAMNVLAPWHDYRFIK